MLLQTKLYVPPPRTVLVPRPRLIHKLGACLDSKMILVAAPAGFGKTTLVSQWLHHSEADSLSRTGWLSLDENDNDLARFLTYLGAALHKIDDHVGQPTPNLPHEPQPPSWQTTLTTWLNDVAASPSHFWLVLDDYHLITEDAVHEAILFILQHMPSNLHLIVASRTDPPLPLGRLRLRGQLTEIGPAELRFTPDEAVAFLNEVMGLKLSREQVIALDDRSEGWIAGLQAAALSLRWLEQDEAIDRFINTFSGRHQYVMEFLVEEVLQQQPAHVRRFLLQTAILDRLCGPLCDSLLEQRQNQAILEQLHRDHLFLIPLDDQRQWYRYHHLFAQTLRNRLHTTTPDRIPDLHRRAAAWFRQQGLASEAIHHAMAAHDFESAAHLVEEFAEPTWTQGQTHVLLGWLKALPAHLVESQPRLSLLKAWALLLAGRWHAVESALQTAEKQMNGAIHQTSPTAPRDTNPQGMAATIRAHLAILSNDPTQAMAYAQQALPQLPQHNLLWRGMITHCLADAQRLLGETNAARKSYGQATRLSQSAGNLFAAVTAVRNLAELQQEQGELHQAADNYRLALRLAQQEASGQGARSTAAANVHIWLGRLLHEWNELETAAHHLEEGVRLSRRSEYPIGLIMGQAALAQVLQLQGKESAAWKLMPQAEQVVLNYNQGRLHWYVKMVKAQLHLARARDHSDKRALAAAVRWAQEQELSAEQSFSYHSRVPLTFASLLIIQGRQQADESKVQSAWQVLDRLLRPSQAAGRTGYVIKLLILKALAEHAQGELATATATVRKALSLAEPEKFIRPFVEEGVPMTELLQQVLETELTRELPRHLATYASGLLKALAAYDIKVQLPPATAKPDASAPLLQAFTDRELDVLRLIAAGRSNRQIAQELVVAASTVKTHINNIYRKLQVHSRTQALARLRELQLS